MQLWKKFDEVVRLVVRYSQMVAWGLLLAMMLVTVVDVAGRFLFDLPVKGGLEICFFILAMIIFLSTASTQLAGRHVRVTLITAHLSDRGQLFSQILGCFVGIIIFGLIAWQNTIGGMMAWSDGACTEALRLPEFSVRFIIGWGSLMLSIACLLNLVGFITKLTEGKKEEV